MNKRVLVGEGKLGRTNASGVKDSMILVKAVEGIIQLSKGRIVVNLTPCDVAELQKHMKSAYHVLRDVPLNCRQVYL